MALAPQSLATAAQSLQQKDLDALNTALGVLANVMQIVSTAAILFQLIENAFSTGPDTTDVLNEIQVTVNDIYQLDSAGQVLNKMQTLANLVNGGQEDLSMLLQEVKNGASINDQEFSQFYPTAHDAAYDFHDISYWLRPYLADLAFWDTWFPNNGQPPISSFEGATFVYDPQLSLLAFVIAITTFTYFTMIYHPDDPLAVAPYFTDLATYLEQNYETSTAGLLTVPLPSLDDLLQMVQFAVGGVLINPVDGQSLPDLGSSGFSQPFQMWHGEIGVTDIYSVFGAEGYSSSLSQFGFFVPTTNSGNIIDVYPTLGTLLNSWLLSPPGWTYPDLTVAQQNVYRWFRIRMRLGNLARWKGLYLAKGYDSVWSFIQKLRALSAGQPGAPGYNSPPTPGPAATDRNAHWCLSDFDAIISELDGSISELDGNYGVGYTYSNYYNWTLTHASQEGEFATSITAENIITRLRGVIDTSTDYASPQNISIGQRPPLPLPTPPRPLSLRQTILAAAI